ncbi:hypothetical protein KSD_18270 [Ktedonobacter sp. SOSP1-85]|uniref:non-ribosomal peptide synthetase n=1 Tax=Ktedonobacter sp. SOSP1-85 TaxID=2778367 RepID=UPI001915A127|nr:non-ribosomal peptide synthetase [Ktedonobacter sp. SOSP1-85]GHO74056.1 hypothetical protein KSD_18270 [Ktedonobacter sp. SOSP1-85]
MSEASKKLAGLSPEQKRALLERLLREKAAAKVELEWATLSQGQRALWFLYRLAPESAAYNLLYSARIQAALDIQALQFAFQELARRYPILTATYATREGEPVQYFQRQQEIPIERIDAFSWSEEALKQRLLVEGNRPFNLEKGPIMRIQLFQRAPQEHILALTVHHIALDFWSLDILIDELYLLYATRVAGSQAALPAAGPAFTEYVRWQSELAKSPEGERLWSYWQEKLAGELPLLNLPLDRPRPPVQTYRGASHSFPFSADLTRKLRALAQSEKATLFMIVLAAFKTLLYRYSHQDDVLVGTPMLGRSRADLEKIVGYLVNPAALRTSLAGNPSFKELLNRVRETVTEALEHQDLPFPVIVERLQPRRDPSYSPIFQSLFIWDRPRKRDESELALLSQMSSNGQNGSHAHNGANGHHAVALPALKLEPYVMGQQGAPFDLTLTIFEMDGGLSADFRYNVDLFDDATIERMGGHLLVLLEGIVAQPEQPILSLPLLTGAEKHQVLVEWNATEATYPEQASIPQLFEEQAQRTPNAEALAYEGSSLTYRELNRRANLLARELRSRGVKPDTLVGVCMERSVEMVVALLGVLKAGGAYVPMDPAYPQERLAYMLEDATVSVLLTQSALLEQLPQHSARVLTLDANWGADNGGELDNLTLDLRPENLIYMIYTSGSTGKPKGVMNTHRGVCNRLHWMQQEYHLTAEDRVLQKTPFSFDVSVWEFFWPLISGATLVMARPGGQSDAAYLAKLIQDQRISTLHFVPSMLHAFLLEPHLEVRCQSLKRVICSGEALTYDLQERFFAHLKSQLHNLYGPTEAAIDVTYWACQPGSKETVIPIGRPIANTQIYILDEAQQPVPVGVSGELYIGGVGIARGYHQRPELNREKFIPDPFSTFEGVRLFRSGDLARYRPDGVIEFLGRIDHQVKIRGFRIELGEIEAALSQHPNVKEAIVIAREDMPGNKRLVAYLVPEQVGEHIPAVSDSLLLSPQEAGLTLEELRTFLGQHLPSYMVPSAFLFLSALPLTPNGKVDRKALPSPNSERPELEEQFVAPRNATEQKLAEIWTEVLGLSRVGIHDNYFDLGGASIQSLEIVARAKEAGIDLPLEKLFEFQTIAELASVLESVSAPQVTAPSETMVQAIAEVELPAVEEPMVPTQPEPKPMQADSSPTLLMNTVIESLGTYLPPKVVTSEEVIQGCVSPIRFPFARLTGIKSRRMAGETEFSIDIARQAVADCLERSKYNPEDIDMIVSGSISRCDAPNFSFSFEPSTAIRLKHHFGLKNAIAFDIDNACTGLFTAINIVDSFLKAGLIRRGIAVSGEYITHIALTAQKELEGFMDSRLPCLTVGDAGAAVLLERAPNQKVGFHEFDMFSLGHYSRDCIGKVTDREHGGSIMYTDAVKVSAVNMKHAVAHAANVIASSGWPSDSFQHVIIHQTSSTTIRDAAREINSHFGKEICTQENVINNIAERGNTATTTQMIAIADHIRSGRIQSGDNAVLGITGSGATIGAAIYTFDDLPERMRRVDAGEKVQKVPSEQRHTVPLLPPTRRVRVESIGTLPAQSPVKKEALALVNAAAENCLAASSYDRKDIDLMIYAGVYRDEFLSEPAIAALSQGDLKINEEIEKVTDKKTFVFDVFNGSIGLLNACHTAIGMIKAQKVNNALVMASEIENNREYRPDVLRGIEETGSAMILAESADGQTGFGNFVFKYFTDYLGAINSHTELHNGKMTLSVATDPCLQEYYLQCIQETVQELLALEQLDLERVKVILPPQISSQFIADLGKTLNVSAEKLVDVQAEHDLFTSSLPYALEQARQQNLARPGDVGLIISVGAGIQVGCATYYF